jgi:lipopolysaccharide/colanic/teichoic acid biosynthesis glycosyltransferase
MNRRIQLALKRAFDVVISSAALTLLSPLIGLIALAIKLDDGGPVLYVQDRVGKDGKTFRCHKFRTMVVGAENKGLGLEVANDDSRITRVGCFLRHWTLDEIPQLFNVLKGDISIVGPRPTVPSQVAGYTPRQKRRLEVKPGLAGWAWIHGRNLIPWAERIELDIWYVDHWSLRLDFCILFRAFIMLLRREGLYGTDGIVHDLK